MLPLTGQSVAGIPAPKERQALGFAMSLSLAVGVLMFIIKIATYLLTGSAAILSDAAESVVHVVAVAFAAYSLWLSYKPADESHLYGHTKITFFSAGFEGAMIGIAAVYIIFEAIRKWTSGISDHTSSFGEAARWLWQGGGVRLDNLGEGTLITITLMLVNGGLGAYLIWIGKKHGALILTANGKHVLTDCWTSLGVVIGLLLALQTGWRTWDPIAAIFVAINILFSGVGLIRASISGLMDAADPAVHKLLVELLDQETAKHGIKYHHLRHRNIGDAYWVEVHLLFRENISVGDAHRIATGIEKTLRVSLKPGSQVTSHLEATEDHTLLHKHQI